MYNVHTTFGLLSRVYLHKYNQLMLHATVCHMLHATCYMLQNTISCLSLFLHMYKIIVSYWLYKHYKNGLKLNNDFSSCCISDA
jgi:hypothetical protein